MTITANWLDAYSLLGLEPLIFFSVEYSQRTVILLSIIAPKNVEFLVVVSGCVVFYLRCVLGN